MITTPAVTEAPENPVLKFWARVSGSSTLVRVFRTGIEWSGADGYLDTARIDLSIDGCGILIAGAGDVPDRVAVSSRRAVGARGQTPRGPMVALTRWRSNRGMIVLTAQIA